MSQCHDEIEGKSISVQDEQRVRELIDSSTKAGRVFLRMLDQGQTIVEACALENIDTKEAMACWHKLTDQNHILSTDGKRPCISTLANAWKRRWESDSAPLWMPVDASIAPALQSGPFMK